MSVNLTNAKIGGNVTITHTITQLSVEIANSDGTKVKASGTQPSVEKFLESFASAPHPPQHEPPSTQYTTSQTAVVEKDIDKIINTLNVSISEEFAAQGIVIDEKRFSNLLRKRIDEVARGKLDSFVQTETSTGKEDLMVGSNLFIRSWLQDIVEREKPLSDSERTVVMDFAVKTKERTTTEKIAGMSCKVTTPSTWNRLGGVPSSLQTVIEEFK